MLRVSVVCLVVLSLTACAGRMPQPVPMVLASDRQLDCGAIEAELKLNNQKISDLAIERGWKMGQNAVAGVIGFMIWPAWLGLDFQDAAGKEATALSQRNEYLLALYRERCTTKVETASLGNHEAEAEPQTETKARGPVLSPLASNTELAAGFVNR